jgi:hypothetical protein
MPFAVAMNPHDADPAFSVSVLDQRHAKTSWSAGEFPKLGSPGPTQ